MLPANFVHHLFSSQPDWLDPCQTDLAAELLTTNQNELSPTTSCCQLKVCESLSYLRWWCWYFWQHSLKNKSNSPPPSKYQRFSEQIKDKRGRGASNDTFLFIIISETIWLQQRKRKDWAIEPLTWQQQQRPKNVMILCSSVSDERHDSIKCLLNVMCGGKQYL